MAKKSEKKLPSVEEIKPEPVKVEVKEEKPKSGDYTPNNCIFG